jgi:hypothetical protein
VKHDFIYYPAYDELEEEFEAYLKMMNEGHVRYLTFDENCNIITKGN